MQKAIRRFVVVGAISIISLWFLTPVRAARVSTAPIQVAASVGTPPANPNSAQKLGNSATRVKPNFLWILGFEFLLDISVAFFGIAIIGWFCYCYSYHQRTGRWLWPFSVFGWQ